MRTILKKSLNLLNVKDIKIFAAMKREDGDRVTLAEFVRKARLNSGLSLKEVERASGRRISSGYVSQIENGHETNLTIDKLIGLAKGLRLSVDTLFAVACGRKAPEGWTESRFYELFEAYESLREERHKEKVARDIDDLMMIIQVFPKKTADDHEGAIVRRISNHRS